MVSPLPLVGGVLGQSHINLGLELISKITVLKWEGKKDKDTSAQTAEQYFLLAQ